MRVNYVALGWKCNGPNLDKKIARVNQPTVAVRARTGQRCKLDLLTRTMNEVLPHAVEIRSWG